MEGYIRTGGMELGKIRRLLGLTTLGLIIVLISGCTPKQQTPGIVEITAEEQMQIILPYTLGMNVLGVNPGIPSYTYLRDYALLSIILKNEKEEFSFIFPYALTDGNKLHLVRDGNLLLLNDEIVSIIIDSDSLDGTMQWIDGASIEELEKIRIVIIKGEPDDAGMSQIRRIAQENTTFGLAVADKELPHFPGFLGPSALEANSEDSDWYKNLDLSEVRYLAVEEPIREFLMKNAGPKLTHVIAMDVDLRKFPEAFAGIQCLITGVEKSETPQPFESSLLSVLPALEEFALAHTDGEYPALIDFKDLPYPEKLKLLAVVENKSGVDFANWSAVSNLEAFTGNFRSDEELSKLIQACPKLRYLNLSEDSLSSLEALGDATNLECLVLGESIGELDFTPLSSLKNLSHIGLPEDVLDDPVLMEKIRKACPQCNFFPQEPFCLGSGWLLLLLPALLFTYLLMRKR